MTIYKTCAASHEGNIELMMECISNWVEEATGKINERQDAPQVSSEELQNWLLILAGSMVFFMQAGFAMVCAGAIRKKNIKNTMIKNLLDACGAGIGFFVFGYAFAFGNSGGTESKFIGNANYFLMGNVDPAVFFFQYAFSATAVTIVAGSVAERCKMAAYFAYSFVLTGFVYPVVVHAFWANDGYFSPTNKNAIIGMGAIDFSGSGVIHLTGGCAALYAACVLGERRGRFHDKDGKALETPGLTKGHSVALQMLGTMMLWFCWYGFNSGSALLLPAENKGRIAALAAVNTTLSAAFATLSALGAHGLMSLYQTGEFSIDIIMAMNGCLSGLVAVTGACGVVEHSAAVFIGIVAGGVYIFAENLLIMCKIDDAVSAIPVHLANGLWGMLAVGFLASPDRLFDAYGIDSHPGWAYAPLSDNLLTAQAVGTLFIIGWTMVTMLPFFLVLKRLGWFRVNELEEFIGLDASYSRTLPLRLEEESSNNEELRLAAYRQRFEEKKQIRQSHPVKPMSVNELLSECFFGDQSRLAAATAFDTGSDDGSSFFEPRVRRFPKKSSRSSDGESHDQEAPRSINESDCTRKK